MNIFVFLSIIFVVFAALMVFVAPFRQFIVGELTAIAILIGYYLPGWLRTFVRTVGVYTAVLTGAVLIGFFLMALAIWVGIPGLTGFLFLFSLSLILLAWLPAGVILNTFGLTDGVVPKILKTGIAWLAFVGFLGLVTPGLFTYYTIVGAALVALILMAASTKINLMDKIIIPLVLLMCLTLAWREFFPESFRSSVRYASSWSKIFDAFKDRGSLNNETDAATSYGVALKNIYVLYTKAPSGLKETEVNIPRGTTVLIASHKDRVLIIDGQSFLKIRLAKKNSSFVNGQTFLVESEYVQIAAPRDIIPEDDSLLPGKKAAAKKAESIQVQQLRLGDNTFRFDQAGDETIWLKFPPNIDFDYRIKSQNGGYQVFFRDGSVYSSTDFIPWKKNPLFRFRSTEPETITIVVWEI